jgi:hypothetical protein
MFVYMVDRKDYSEFVGEVYQEDSESMSAVYRRLLRRDIEVVNDDSLTLRIWRTIVHIGKLLRKTIKERSFDAQSYRAV